MKNILTQVSEGIAAWLAFVPLNNFLVKDVGVAMPAAAVASFLVGITAMVAIAKLAKRA